MQFALRASLLGVTVHLAVSLTATGHAQADEQALAMVDKAATYVAEYERRLSSVVCEEHQRQEFLTPDGRVSRTRTLVSDLLIANTSAGFLSFRDVMTVDGTRVNDREARLRKLFLENARPPLEQARQIAEETSRYNIGVRRDLDPMMMALGVLRPGSTTQFRFTRTADGVAFEEWPAKPGTRPDPDAMAVHGRFTIGANGQVLGSTFLADHPEGHLSVQVRYAEDPDVQLLVPVEMREAYDSIGRRRSDDTRVLSTYSNCRQYQVIVEERLERVK